MTARPRREPGQPRWDCTSIDREVGLLRSIRHDNIVRLRELVTPTYTGSYDLDQSAPKQFHLVLAPACKSTLISLTTTDDRWYDTAAGFMGLSAKRCDVAAEMLRQIGDACHYMHRLGTIHHDVKPDNIGIVAGPSGLETPIKFILFDLGAAQEATETADHTRGTVRYLAPEVMAIKEGRTLKKFTNKVDVWALGLVAREVWFGTRVRDPPHAVMLADETPDTGTTFSRTLKSMLRKDPKQRSSMAMVVHAMKLAESHVEGTEETRSGVKRSWRQIDLGLPDI
ncbi:hypothetical protein LTR56_027705 [Elasticomyces elasticus]|nr:hypothetical protein LTR56_027705 [Elasticomyces elasticus]